MDTISKEQVDEITSKCMKLVDSEIERLKAEDANLKMQGGGVSSHLCKKRQR